MKKALCVGVSYAGNASVRHPLHKAHADARAVQRLLQETYEYDDVRLLIDSEDSYDRPTREGIMQGMKDLVRDVSAGDRLVFHYSGHGSQLQCQDGQEADGQDEVIWPEDVEIPDYPGVDESNVIIDNDIHRILVDDLPAGVHLTIIFDACHSGTAADLPEYTKAFRPRKNFKIKRQPRFDEEPKIVSWSACRDAQTIVEFGKTGGLLVYYLCQQLKENPNNTTYYELIKLVSDNTRRIYQMTIERDHKLRKALVNGIPEPELSVLGDYELTMREYVEF